MAVPVDTLLMMTLQRLTSCTASIRFFVTIAYPLFIEKLFFLFLMGLK